MFHKLYARRKTFYDDFMTSGFLIAPGPVARRLVSANRWLRGIKMYRFPWFLTLVSTNHASSNPGHVAKRVKSCCALEREKSFLTK